MVVHNNPLQRPHLRKHWKPLVKTYFNQAGHKLARRQKRITKAKNVFPRPIDSLRPIVHKTTFRYTGQPREGRGFSIEELRLAGLHPRFARTVGIAVDSRRTNKSAESLERNVKRLKTYVEKLVLLPQREGKPRLGKKGFLPDTTAKVEAFQNLHKGVLSVPAVSLREKRVVITPEMKAFRAHGYLRLERTNQKWAGKRALKNKPEGQ